MHEMLAKGSKVLLYFIRGLVIIAVCYYLVELLVWSINTYRNRFCWAGIIVSCVTVIWFKLSKKEFKLRFPIFWIVFFAWIVFQFIYVYMVYCQGGADVSAALLFAEKYLGNRACLVEGDWHFDYLCRYTNNAPMMLWYIWVLRITRLFTGVLGPQYESLLLAYCGAVLADIAILFSCFCVKEIENKQLSVSVLLVAIVMIGLSEPAKVMYTDILALWTVPVGVYTCLLAIKSEKRRRISFLIISGAIFGIGMVIKPQVAIIPIAGGILGGLGWLAYKEKSKYFKTILLVGIISLAGYKVEKMVVDLWMYTRIAPKEYIEQTTFPALHYMNMGLFPATHGSWNGDDVTLMWETKGLDEKKAICMESIKARLAEKGENTIPFLLEKASIATADGSFSNPDIWNAGAYNQSEQAIRFQNVFSPKKDGWNIVFGPLIQFLYFGMMASELLNILKMGFRKECTKQSVMADLTGLSMLGVFLFIMLFEMNHRYFYIMLPMMIIGGAIYLDEINRAKQDILTGNE